MFEFKNSTLHLCSIVTVIRRPFHVGDRSRKGVPEDHLQHAKGFFFSFEEGLK